MLQPLKGGKAFQNLEVEGTELSEIVTWMKKEIQGKSGQVSQEFLILSILKKIKVAERTEAAKSTKLWWVILKRWNSMPKGNGRDNSFDQNVIRSKWESLKKITHVASRGNQGT